MLLDLPPELVRSALDSAPDAMVIIGNDGGIIFANQQVTTLFGHPHDDLIGRPIEQLLPARFRERHAGHRHHYKQNLRLRPMGIGLELYALRRDGSEFPVEISLSPIHSGTVTYVAAAIRDATDRKRAEQELKAAHTAADLANQAKSRFLATASHDIRQPLQALMLLSGAMRRMTTSNELLEVLEHQDRAISAMSRLLIALLDVSKLESGATQPAIKDFRVSALFDELRIAYADVARDKGLELLIEPSSESVHSDPALVGQVLHNFLSNAFKYTPRGSIRVRARRDANKLHIEITDSGLGIASHEIAHIFEEFYQVGVSTDASREGYGLGLSIVQRIAKLLNVEIGVVSQPGKGSTFSLVLPTSAASSNSPAPQIIAARGVSPRAAPLHVLLVEDDPGVRNATRIVLQISGYRVTPAASLPEALECARKAPDLRLVVTDYHLDQGHTGIQVISRLRELLGKDLKAVLVTGDTSTAMRDLHHDVNSRFLSKPIDSDELLTVMAELLAPR